MDTYEQKVGQMMLVGYRSESGDDIIENIKRYNFGNIILFSRNITSASQLKDLTGRLTETALEYNGAPPFIAIDQEGGNVRRIYDGITPVPGAMALGAASAKCPAAAAIAGGILGQELKQLGINLNLAPVVDINSNPLNPIIAIRSFGDDPHIVKRLAADFATAQQSHGVMACYKHFLGHGDAHVDSHIDMPRIDKSIERIRNMELVPYIGTLAADAVMTAHILYTELDDRFPASISDNIIRKILREELNFGGLVITDCFEMEGLIQTFSFEEAAVFAVKATTDLITVSHTFGRQLAVRNALLKAVKSGKIPSQTFASALSRIAGYKRKYCYSHTEPQKLDRQRNEHLAQSISNAGITLASGQPFEISPQNTIVIGVTNYLNSIAEDSNVERMDIAKRIGEEFGIPSISIDNKNFHTSDIVRETIGKKVILALSDSHLTLVQRVLYSTIHKAKRPIMLISLRTPYDILGQDMPTCHICLYGYTAQSVDSLIAYLKGGEAHGRLPVNLGKHSQRYIRDSDSKNVFMDNVIAYMRQNYAKKITLDNVAENFMVTGGYLCKLFRRKLNGSFVDTLNLIRIGEAKKLLNSTNHKVYEIASLCGYNDYNYFVRIFKKYIGVTPNYYRNSYHIMD